MVARQLGGVCAGGGSGEAAAVDAAAWARRGMALGCVVASPTEVARKTSSRRRPEGDLHEPSFQMTFSNPNAHPYLPLPVFRPRWRVPCFPSPELSWMRSKTSSRRHPQGDLHKTGFQMTFSLPILRLGAPCRVGVPVRHPTRAISLCSFIQNRARHRWHTALARRSQGNRLVTAFAPDSFLLDWRLAITEVQRGGDYGPDQNRRAARPRRGVPP